MAVPWQTDTASCRGGYDKSYDPYVPTFWPARVPNDVLTQEDYNVVMDDKQPMDERKAAFARRARWITPLGSASYTDQINNMVAHFDHLRVIKAVPGPEDTDEFPPVLEVEDCHEPIGGINAEIASLEVAQETMRAARSPTLRRDIDLTQIEKVRRFPGGLPVQNK